jgi:hypothetical protein
MHFLRHKEKVKGIEDYVQRVTAVGRKRVEDAARAITQKQEEIRNAENTVATTREPNELIEEMINVFQDNLNILARSDDEEDGDDSDDEYTVPG